MAHIFISYEKTDREVADQICRYLEEQGLQCWIAPRNVLAGKEWDVSIIEAIKKAGCMILVFSSQADASRQVKREVTIADNHKVPIIPCRITNVEPSNLAYFLTLAHWFDAFESSLENHLLQLLMTITSNVPDLQAKPLVTEPEHTEPELPEPPPKVEVDDQPEKGASVSKESTNNIGMKFVLVPAGTFIMGSPEDEEGRSYDEQQHQVTISRPFYLQTTPVTQGQWQKVMGNNPSLYNKCGEICPVEMVSWHEAQVFIEKLNRMEKNDKYRMPTEAEWEYACRAGSKNKWCFGDNEIELSKYAWRTQPGFLSSIFCSQTQPVSQLKPNAWGFYDMHGMVWEWCQDWYGEYPPGSVTDPKGPSSGEFRVCRGGAWNSYPEKTRSAHREKDNPDGCVNIGFRVARAL